jgi:hypothetical protein
MDHPDLRILTLHHFGELPEEDLRVTLAAMNIKMIAAKDGTVQNRPVKITTILFMDSEPVTLNLNEIDLMAVENVVGAYGFMEM